MSGAQSRKCMTLIICAMQRESMGTFDTAHPGYSNIDVPKLSANEQVSVVSEYDRLSSTSSIAYFC